MMGRMLDAEVVWKCAEPPMGAAFQVIRAKWNADFTRANDPRGTHPRLARGRGA
jgi:hypothetical protein